MIGVLGGDEDAVQPRIVDLSLAAEILEPRTVLEGVQGQRAGGAEIDQQRVLGHLLSAGPLRPGLDQGVGLVVAPGEGAAHAEKRQGKHECISTRRKTSIRAVTAAR